MSNEILYSFLNKIPTNLRGKYISDLKNCEISNKNILLTLKNLAIEVNNKFLPKITYPNLPVSDKLEDIKNIIQNNQVIVVAGETGSGKST